MNKKVIALIFTIVLVLIVGFAIIVVSNTKQEENITTVDEAISNNTNQEQAQENIISSNKILTIYFSMTGNTEKIANFIHEEVGGDIVKLETKETYPTEYNVLLSQAQKEKAENARPELKTKINIEDYDVIFLGYPIWCYTMPMPIYTFLDEYDLSGKVLIPFTTHGTSGTSGTFEEIEKREQNAIVLKGFGAYDETVNEKQEEVKEWLKELGFTTTNNTINNNKGEETPISITIGDLTVEGKLNGTELAEEIKDMMPLKVSMGRFGTREFYGGIKETPKNTGEGKLNFENGDITYCPTNNTLAIFYNQSDRPNLTMEVIKIGEVTSDLSIFDEIDSSVEMIFEINE